MVAVCSQVVVRSAGMISQICDVLLDRDDTCALVPYALSLLTATACDAWATAQHERRALPVAAWVQSDDECEPALDVEDRAASHCSRGHFAYGVPGRATSQNGLVACRNQSI